MIDANGQLLHGEEEQLNRWKNHFCTVLNHAITVPYQAFDLPQLPSLRVKTDPPTVRELISAIKALPNFKASGVDGIPADFYKTNPALVAKSSATANSLVLGKGGISQRLDRRNYCQNPQKRRPSQLQQLAWNLCFAIHLQISRQGDT